MTEIIQPEVEIDEDHAIKVIDAILKVNEGKENYVTVFYALQATIYLVENMSLPGKGAESLENVGIMFLDHAAEVAAEDAALEQERKDSRIQ